MTLLQKDTRLAVAAAQTAGFTGPLGASAAAVFEAASQAGMAELDDAAVFKYLQSHHDFTRTHH
jgi:3-hydroxyisobutyrate dehydrogenase-like beta-hydroxyacid dehydrogenase